ncbi:FIST N-terminal domain-containing protein [Oribacterium sp. WCC10]|uniref:FIST N-terminal domain-containing protein n=1 Tax=Oribacterium sp. WCC10 TaxID=1855343 RepID=UPI0008E47DC7|nr:FIST N-terminal domain-containing protein [Oribacterium sp. WCC10]SFG51188.1 Uncharacterized conserved protein, contains FIST_N domain [Oribacterium sp. WCC10]
MQSKVGYSSSIDVKAAVEEATRGISDPIGLIIMTDHARLADISTLLKRKYPKAQSIGVSGINYYGTQSSDRNLIIAAITGEAVLHAGVIRNLSTCPAADLINLKESMRIVNGSSENTVLIEYCTNDEERLTTTLQMAVGESGIHVVGGTEFGYPADATPAVTVNGILYPDACAYMLIKNTNGGVHVYSEVIYGPMEGHAAHNVTRANLKDKEVMELDHQPIANVYSREMNIPVEKVIDSTLEHPFGRMVGDQVFIASQKELKSGGSLTFFKRLNVNDAVRILQLKDFASINKETCAEILSETSSPSLMISVNCIYRYLLFTGNGYYPTLLQNMAAIGPHIGNIGGGEQVDNQHVNQTMVVAVFE